MFLVVKLIILSLNHFIGTNIMILEGKAPKIIASFLPLALMVIGGIGSDQNRLINQG